MLELGQLLRLLMKWKWRIGLSVVGAMALAGVISLRTTPLYRATCVLAAGPMLEGYPLTEADLRMGQDLARNYAQLATLGPLLSSTGTALGLTASEAAELSQRVSVQAIQGTQYLRISVVDPEYNRARKIADELASQMVASRQEDSDRPESVLPTLKLELDGLEGDLRSARDELARLRKVSENAPTPSNEVQNRISLLEGRIDRWRGAYFEVLNRIKGSSRVSVLAAASGPSTPISPSTKFNLVVAAAGALFLVVLVMLLVEYPPSENRSPI